VVKNYGDLAALFIKIGTFNGEIILDDNFFSLFPDETRLLDLKSSRQCTLKEIHIDWLNA
jgi:hypothetical protein